MKHVIIDTDPGIDDVLAMLYALNHPEVHVLGFTTVAGNVPVELGTRNALTLLEKIGRTDVPVVEGASRPLRRPLHTAEVFHGADGLANMNLPAPKGAPSKQSAVKWMAQVLRNTSEPVTVIALGPLTNLASLFIEDPEAFGRISEVVFMGGAAACPGNTTPRGEFNIYVDPDAAQIVTQSGVPLVMVGLDVTMKVILRLSNLERLTHVQTPVAQFFQTLMKQALQVIPVRAELGGCALHDPLAVGVAIHPQFVTTKDCHLEVETEGIRTLGETVVDLRHFSATPPNAKVCFDVDGQGFIDHFLDIIGREND